MQQQITQNFLQAGDLITISFNNLILSAQGFKSSDVKMLPLNATSKPFQTLFRIQSDAFYDTPLYLVHLISGKYLCCGTRGIKLTSNKKASCEIVLKPIFRCQIAITRRVRINQQVIISPADIRTRQDNLAFVANPFRIKNIVGCQILIKRNQATHFSINIKSIRNKQPGSLTTNAIYQLMNLQTEKSMAIKQQEHNVIYFQKTINQHDIYLQLSKTGQFNHQVKEQIINFNEEIYIRSYKTNKFLSVNRLNKSTLQSQENQDCVFIIQPYHDKKFTSQSFIKIKHKRTGKYLSINPLACLQQFKLLNVFQLKQIPQKKMRDTLFINELCNSLKKQLISNSQLKQTAVKIKIKQLLLQIIKFIYGKLQIQTFQAITFASSGRKQQKVDQQNKSQNKKNHNNNEGQQVNLKQNDFGQRIRITKQEQDLLGNVGILQILKQILTKLLPFLSYSTDSSNNETMENQKQVADQSDILSYIMMVTAGVCYNHSQNTRIFIKGIITYYEAIGYVDGAIQCLYNIFKNNKTNLLILQATQHSFRQGQSSKNQTINSIEILLSLVARNKNTPELKVHIIKLLETLCISRVTSGSQNIFRHQLSILKAMNSRKLQSLIIPLKTNQHNDLIITTLNGNHEEQLEEILMWKNKYQAQIQILEAQLNLIASLCYNLKGSQSSYIREMISEEVIYRYLKGNLTPEFRQIFMRLLIQIYLKSDNTSNSIIIVQSLLRKQKKVNGRSSSKMMDDSSNGISSRLMKQQGDPYVQMQQMTQPEHYKTNTKTIQKIQNLVLEVTRRAISNQVIDRSFYMNIKALRKFLQLKILHEKEIIQFRLILIEFVQRFSSHAFLQEEKKNLMIEILKIFFYYQQLDNQRMAVKFVVKLSYMINPKPQKVEQQLLQFYQENISQTNLNQQQLSILSHLLKQSLDYQDEDIFYHCSSLLRLIQNKKALFISGLKQKIIIASEWTYETYNKILKLVSLIKLALQEHKQLKGQHNQKAVSSQQQKINQLLKQLNYFFYQWPSSTQNSNIVSPLAQNIFRQLDVHKFIINFLNQNANDSKNNSSSLITTMRTCFQFLLLFIENNNTNLLIMSDFFIQGKNIFQTSQCGQGKFIYKILKMPKSKQVVWRRIYRCLLSYLRKSNTPNPYSILSLMILFHDQTPQQGKNSGKINKDTLQNFANLLITDQQFLLNFLKVQKKTKGKYEVQDHYSFIYSTRISNKQSYSTEWFLYLMQLSKLLLMLIQHYSQNHKIIQIVQKCMPLLAMIQQPFNCQDLLQNLSMDALSSTLMKKQLIKLFLRVHTDSLRSVKQVQTILSFIQKNYHRIINQRKDQIGGAQFLVDQLRSGRVSDQGKVIIQTYFYSQKMKKSFMNNFNPIFTSVTIFFPFILKILHSLSTGNKLVDQKEDLRSQIDTLFDIIFRKFKEIVNSKITHSEFVPNFKQYINAIETCQQIFRRKIGFSLVYEDQEQDNDQYDTRTQSMLFIPSKMSNLVGNYRVSQSPQQKNQKIIYQSLIHILLSQNVKKSIISSLSKQFVVLEKQRIPLAQKITINLMNKNRQQFGNLLDNVKNLFDLSSSSINQEVIKKIVSQVQNENQDLSNKKLAKFFQIGNQITRKHIDMIQHTNQSIIQRIKANPVLKNKPSDDIIKNLNQIFSEKLVQRAIKLINKERDSHLNYGLLDHINKQMNNIQLSYEIQNQSLTIQSCLQWIRNNLVLIPPSGKQQLNKLIIQIVQLIKVYGVFILQFKGKYLSKKLRHKLQLCYSILFHGITGCSMKNILYLIQRQAWNQVNIILKLDDSYDKNLSQIQADTNQLFRKIASYGFKSKSRNYIEQLKVLYKNSNAFYSDYFPTNQIFPLVPTKSYYSVLKKWIIAFLKEFKLLPSRIANQFLTRINIATLDKNIIQTWEKHQHLIGNYDIGSIQVDLIYEKKDEKYEIAKNMDFQNAVDLCSIKMYIQNTSGNGQLQTQYKNARINIFQSKKISSVFSSIGAFLRDLVLLIISCFLPLCQKPKKKQKSDIQTIMRFFFTKIARIQLLSNNNVFLSEFLIRPQCKISQSMHKKLLDSISFVSIQLKLQSILKNGLYFILFFINQINYYEKYNKWKIMQFLDNHVRILKWIGFILVILQNFLLIINSTTNRDFFTDINFSQPFVILQLFNMAITYIVLLKYFLKDVPLLFMKVNLQLARRAQSYGSNYKNYSNFTKFVIKGSKILFDTSMIYHLLYTLAVSLCLYNKLFASIVLLDIFFQVPTLTNLLYAIWKPKVELVLAIVSFTLIQYFFSIFMFFNFRSQTLGFCDTLGGCFGFVFVTTYKAAGGFVGYLFQQQSKTGTIDTAVTFFQIFQDLYVVIIFQIFFALILSIIIDNFTQIRNQISERKENLDSHCIVCNLDRTLFNISSKINFKGHIAINHSIWNYFYFYEYVLKKDPIFRNYFERQIYQKRNADFIPNNYAKGIKQPQQDLSTQIVKLFGG